MNNKNPLPENLVKVCFVCLGNICRSPLAHGIFEELTRSSGLVERIETHSAGTGDWHVGQPADRRMRATAQRKGVEINTRAQQFQPSFFERFDLILAMDRNNERDILSQASNTADREKVRLFRSFDPDANGDLDVPDPYYGGEAGFENVFHIVHRTCPEILAFLKTRYSIGR